MPYYYRGICYPKIDVYKNGAFLHRTGDLALGTSFKFPLTLSFADSVPANTSVTYRIRSYYRQADNVVGVPASMQAIGPVLVEFRKR